ncbi:ABC-type transport auxiliary lipoprotein family protein [Ottowia pentelensis]
MGARAVFCLMFVLLSGCALPLPDKPVRPAAYDLGPPLAMPAAAPGVALGFDRVEAPTAIDTNAIVYRLLYAGGSQQPRPYAHARWSMAPAQLVGQRLRAALAASHPVLDAGNTLAVLQLSAELDEFAQVFTTPEASEGVVRLRVTAIAPQARQGRLLGQRSFVQRVAAPTPDAAGGAQALREATDTVLREVVDWVNALPAPRS